MQPLAEYAVRVQPPPHHLVVLDGEQIRHAGHPRIGRFADDDVVLARLGQQMVAAVVQNDTGLAGVLIGQSIDALEVRRRLDHGRFDFGTVPLVFRIRQSRTEGRAAAKADDQAAFRRGMQEHRQVPGQNLCAHVDAGRCIGLAVYFEERAVARLPDTHDAVQSLAVKNNVAIIRLRLEIDDRLAHRRLRPHMIAPDNLVGVPAAARQAQADDHHGRRRRRRHQSPETSRRSLPSRRHQCPDRDTRSNHHARL